MRSGEDPPPGDRVRVSIRVEATCEVAFRVFTEDIDRWWRRGLKYRVAGTRRGFIRIEPGVGGRLFESFEDDSGATRIIDTGRVLAWEPPFRLVFEWRSVTFAPAERTEVEVGFVPDDGATLVTLTHVGWASLRPDHPVRHGDEAGAFIRRMGLWWGDLLSELRRETARRAD